MCIYVFVIKTYHYMFIAKIGFYLDFHWDFHLASWHVSCSLAMLAVLLSQNVLCLFPACIECNCKCKQETNIRQHNATLESLEQWHNEQETKLQTTKWKMNMSDSININMKNKKQPTSLTTWKGMWKAEIQLKKKIKRTKKKHGNPNGEEMNKWTSKSTWKNMKNTMKTNEQNDI